MSAGYNSIESGPWEDTKTDSKRTLSIVSVTEKKERIWNPRKLDVHKHLPVG